MKKLFEEILSPLFAEDIDVKNIVNDILGTTNPDKIANLVQNALSPYIQSDIEKFLFFAPCAGVVFGFELKSGEKIVFKVYNRLNSYSYLKEMNRIQEFFILENFPAPQVLSPIFSFHNTHAGLYGIIEGEKENAHDPIVRAELAKYLAKFSGIVDKYQFKPILTFMQESMKGKLWPVPHNVMFDLKKTTRHAGWITKKARAANKIINSYRFPKKLAYTDWDVKNTLFKNKKLIGVFDWDSLGALSEPEMVGRAAAQFTADWESNNKVTPTPDEGRAFVKSYEEFRGRPFTKEEYLVVSASADYLIALISRFAHKGRRDSTEGPYQDLLRECYETSFLFA